MSTVALVPVVPGENAAGQPTVPDTASATTSFADLLDDSQAPKQKTHKAETTHRAYSFAELGMFGLHDLVLPPDPKQKDATAGKSDAKLAAVTPTAATSKAATASTSSAPQPLVYVPFLQTESNAGNTVMGVTLPGGGSTGLSGITGIRSFAGGSTIDQVKPLRQTAPSPAELAKHQDGHAPDAGEDARAGVGHRRRTGPGARDLGAQRRRAHA